MLRGLDRFSADDYEFLYDIDINEHRKNKTKLGLWDYFTIY